MLYLYIILGQSVIRGWEQEQGKAGLLRQFFDHSLMWETLSCTPSHPQQPSFPHTCQHGSLPLRGLALVFFFNFLNKALVNDIYDHEALLLNREPFFSWSLSWSKAFVLVNFLFSFINSHLSIFICLIKVPTHLLEEFLIYHFIQHHSKLRLKRFSFEKMTFKIWIKCVENFLRDKEIYELFGSFFSSSLMQHYRGIKFSLCCCWATVIMSGFVLRILYFYPKSF